MVVRRMMKNREELKRMRKLLAVGVLMVCLAGMSGCAGAAGGGVSASGSESDSASSVVTSEPASASVEVSGTEFSG